MRVSLFAGLLLCAACQPTRFFQAYPGPMRPPEEHARIALPPEVGTALTAISCVDGQREPAPEACVLPGRHYITVLFIRGRSSIEGPLWLDAEAGHTYDILWEDSQDFSRIRFWLVDAQTRRPVGGIVGSEPNPGPEEKICVPRRYRF